MGLVGAVLAVIVGLDLVITDSDSAYEGHSGWLMLLCCALMVVAVVLIALGR